MSNNDRYLWLGLEAGLWPSYVLEHRLANALADAGRDVTMIECQGVLRAQCPVMTANHIPVNASAKSRAPICGDCRHNAALVQSRSRYSSLSLDAYVTDEIRAEVAGLMAGVTVNNWSDLTVDGIPVGRYATYLTMLHHKLPDVTSSEDAWSEYLADLRNALLVLRALPAIFEEKSPTHVVVYNPLYPTHRMFVEFAQARGIGMVSVSAGSYLPGRYDTAFVFPRIESSQTMVDSSTIRDSLDIPCSDLEISAVSRHLAELICGADPWVYSTQPSGKGAADVRQTLGARPDSPIVTVLVSSPDETRSSILVGAEYVRDSENGFSDIAEFIAQVVQAARQLPHIDFVFRLHPRLLPNKRERVTSPDLLAIEDALASLPPNAVINSPIQQLSLYDTIRISSAAINQSSSAGLEFLALGLPVVQFDPARQNAYPPSLGVCAGRYDVDGLTVAIESAIESGWSIENSRKAFRWLATILLRATLHLAPLELVEDDTDAEEVVHRSESAPPAWRRIIPTGIRERVSRHLARRTREVTLDSVPDATNWTGEWTTRIDSLDNDRIIWEPLALPRGEANSHTESMALEATVQGFIQRITAGDAEGLGALKSH
jgi:hypothetical protein